MEEKKIVLGSGKVTLDQLQKFADDTVSEEYVGGTLGNIMMIMAHYGWHAMPVTRLDVSVDSEKMVDDMKASGMDLRYVIREEGGKTPVIFQRNYIKRDGSKGKSIGAPEGRSRFIPFSAITKKTAQTIIEELNEVPDVLVFDRAYPAYIDLAKHFKEKGALVYFEPESISPVNQKNVEKLIALSDVVKYSGKRIKDTTQFEKYTDTLFIETRSEEGLRFRLHGTWHAVAAPELPGEFMDEEGAGDWTSATFIHLLTAHGVRHIADLSADDCAALLAQAQKKGAENCCREGARGLMRS